MGEYAGIIVIILMVVLAVFLYPYKRKDGKKNFWKQAESKNKKREKEKNEDE